MNFVNEIFFQYDGDDYPQYEYENQYDGGATPTQQTDYGQYYDYNYDGQPRFVEIFDYFITHR